MRKDDEKRIIKKNLKTLDSIMNDAVKVSKVLQKYDEESAVMSVIGAAFTTWCDMHELVLSERWQLLKQLMELQDRVNMVTDVNVTNGFPGMTKLMEIDADIVVSDDGKEK